MTRMADLDEGRGQGVRLGCSRKTCCVFASIGWFVAKNDYIELVNANQTQISFLSSSVHDQKSSYLCVSIYFTFPHYVLDYFVWRSE